MPLSYELWKLKTAFGCFSVSIIHNSKIRELSDGNRVMETELSFGQTTFLLWVSPFLSYELWKQRIELSKNSIQTASKCLENSRQVQYLDIAPTEIGS